MAQRVAGEMYESITGQLFEIGRQLRQPNGYPFSPEDLKIHLQKAIEGCFGSKNYQLYLHPKQQEGGSIRGFDLETHLKETGHLARAFGLEDELVKGWLANPKTYPEEFKGKAIFLWKSVVDRDGRRSAPYLDWDDERVEVHWYWLGRGWSALSPALLAS